VFYAIDVRQRRGNEKAAHLDCHDPGKTVRHGRKVICAHQIGKRSFYESAARREQRAAFFRRRQKGRF
jgi:hypothetical protein